MLFEEASVLFRLDYLSCVLTVLSTILLGKRCWEGWILAGINSVIVCRVETPAMRDLCTAASNLARDKL
jgi:hypothetical protein